MIHISILIQLASLVSQLFIQLFLRGKPHLHERMKRLPSCHKKTPIAKNDLSLNFYELAKTSPLPSHKSFPINSSGTISNATSTSTSHNPTNINVNHMNINMNMPSSSVGSSMNSYMSTVSADNTQGQDLLRLLNQQGMQHQQQQDQCIESMQQQQQQQNQDMYVKMMHQLQQRRMNFPSLINSNTISATTTIQQPTTSGATSVEPASTNTSSNNDMSTNCITTSTSNASDINIHDIMALRSIEHTNELLVQKLESLRRGNVANPIDMQQQLNDKSNHPNTNDKSFSNITSTTSSQLPEQPGSNSKSSPSKSPSR